MKINTKNQKSVAEVYEALATKAATKDATKMITESWAPMIQRTTGVTDSDKLGWMSEMAHNITKSLNESAPTQVDGAFGGGNGFGGVYTPYNTLYNTYGVGDIVPAGQPALTAADYARADQNGSGDKFPAILPLALKVAAKTIGLELVNVINLQGPAGVLPYMDYVYTGSKAPYGATPSFNPTSANINGNWHGTNAAYSFYDLPSAFKATMKAPTGTTMYDYKKTLATAGLKAGITYTVADSSQNTVLTVEFAGWSRIDGDPMFKVVGGTQSLGSIFEAAGTVTFTCASKDPEGDPITGIDLNLYGPKLISMQEDHILGYTGAGAKDDEAWAGTFQDGTVMYEPMTRGTEEMTAPRQISLRLFTKHIQVGSIQVGCAVTQDQVTDLQKQWGIDVIKLVENSGIAELSQTINRHITSRLFGLGWKNQIKLIEVEGMNANLNMTFQATAQTTPAFAFPVGTIDEQGNYTGVENAALPCMQFNTIAGATFENRDTLIKRIFTNILQASNWIQQRGRYGGANFVVTNIRVASLLQSNAHYSFSPIENTLSQSAGQLYPIGKVCNMTVYVDPLMAANDTRVLVGRKGDKEEPGTYFCPYVMAQVVRTIAEGTGAPKLYIKSRYALVDAGFFPETQYFTFYVDTTGL